MRKIETPIYLFEELKADAQTVAVGKMIELYCIDYNEIPEDMIDDFLEAEKETERLRTPWFFSQIFSDKCLNKLIRECKKLEYYSTGIPYGILFCDRHKGE